MSWHTTRQGLMRPVMRADAPLVRAAVRARAEQGATASVADVMRGHDDMMRADARPAAGSRTIVVPLLDSPGATLTVTCPEWCTSDHRRDVEHGTFAADFTHHGTAEELGAGGDDPLLSVRIEQRPFSCGNWAPMAATWPEAGPDNGELTADGVYALADRLRAYAEALDELGVDLDCARATDRQARGERGEQR